MYIFQLFVFYFCRATQFIAWHVLFVGNLTRKLCKNMKRVAAAMWIQKHMRRCKAQKAQKQRYQKCFCICYNKHIYNCLLELFLFAMLNLVKLLCTFFSYLFFSFTEQHNLLLNMCCLQVTLLASFVKTWRGRKL